MLIDLIQTNILDQESPQRLPPVPRKKRNNSQDALPRIGLISLKDNSLEEVIAQVMQRNQKKIHQEKDLCKYLPSAEGSRLHYATFKKMKKKEPLRLKESIEKYLLSSKKPKLLPSLSRSNKRLQEEEPIQKAQTSTDQLTGSIKELSILLKSQPNLSPALTQERTPQPLPSRENFSVQLLKVIQNQLEQVQKLVGMLQVS